MSQFKLAWSRFCKSKWFSVFVNFVFCLFCFSVYKFAFDSSSYVDIKSDTYGVGAVCGFFLYSLLPFFGSLFAAIFKRRSADQED